MADDSSAENLAPLPEPPEAKAFFDPNTFDVQDPENSFRKLLAALTYYDDTIDSIDWSLIDQIFEKGAAKVDALAYVRSHLENRITYVKGRVAEWTAALSSAVSGLNNFDAKVKYAMERNGFTEFKGNDYRVFLKASSYCDLEGNNVECTSAHKIHYSEFVKVSYDWELKKLTDALKLPDGDPLREKAAKVAALKTRLKPVIEIVRENEKQKKKGKAK